MLMGHYVIFHGPVHSYFCSILTMYYTFLIKRIYNWESNYRFLYTMTSIQKNDDIY